MPTVDPPIAAALSGADIAGPIAARRRGRLRAGAARGVAFAPHLVILAAVLALSFLSGGYVFERATPVALAMLGLAAVWVWVAPRRLAWSPLYLAGLTLFGAFVAWTGASVVWSIGPDLSWRAFDYALLYLLVAFVAGAVPCGRAQLRLVGYGYVLITVPVAVYGLLGKVAPDVLNHAHHYARLSQPLGYWNALAIVLALAAPLALQAASRRGMPVILRGLSAAALALFLFTLFFSFSRGGSLALLAALVVYFALANERLAGAASLVLATGPVAATLYHARGLATLFSATDDDSLRTAQGHALGRWVLASLIVVLAAQVVAALLHRRLHPSRGMVRAAGAVLLVLVVAGAVYGTKLYVDRYGGPGGFVRSSWDQLTGKTTGSEASGSATRLLSISDNGRIYLVKTGVRQWEKHPLAGTGAGTFRFTNYLYRSDSSMIVKHAQPVDQRAERVGSRRRRVVRGGPGADGGLGFSPAAPRSRRP